MTDAELVRLTAEKVMGWTAYDTEGGYEWWGTNGRGDLSRKSWNPLTSDSDAMMLLDAVLTAQPKTEFSLRNFAIGWLAEFEDEHDKTVDALEADRRRAITIAAVRAVGEDL